MTGVQRGRDRQFGVGVNYWPARTAMAWWERFDIAEVEADFQRIAAAGFQSVRIFLLWESFQPSPRDIRSIALARLVAVADVAERSGLALVPTLFTGHMSGANFVPPWAFHRSGAASRFRVVSHGTASTGSLRNWYDDVEVADAQRQLASACATALAGHPALWAWDLGNENSNCVLPESRSSALAWLASISTAIRDADDHVEITTGLHMEDLEEDRRLGPAEAATVCDFLTMHGYPIYATWTQGPTDAHLVGFLTCITRWLGGGADVYFSELGLSTAPHIDTIVDGSMQVGESDAAAYIDRAISSVHAAGAFGAMVWCYSDYAPAIWNEPPLDEAQHERSFGLWRADGTPKPSVKAATRDRAAPSPRPDLSWIDVAPDAFYGAGGTHLQRLYTRYLATLAPTPRGG